MRPYASAQNNGKQLVLAAEGCNNAFKVAYQVVYLVLANYNPWF